MKPQYDLHWVTTLVGALIVNVYRYLLEQPRTPRVERLLEWTGEITKITGIEVRDLTPFVGEVGTTTFSDFTYHCHRSDRLHVAMDVSVHPQEFYDERFPEYLEAKLEETMIQIKNSLLDKREELLEDAKMRALGVEGMQKLIMELLSTERKPS